MMYYFWLGGRLGTNERFKAIVVSEHYEANLLTPLLEAVCLHTDSTASDLQAHACCAACCQLFPLQATISRLKFALLRLSQNKLKINHSELCSDTSLPKNLWILYNTTVHL